MQHAQEQNYKSTPNIPNRTSKDKQKIPQHTPPTLATHHPTIPSSVKQNSGVTGGAGGRVPPETSDLEISAGLSGKKKRQEKKGKNGEEKKENCKKEGVKLKWKEGKLQNEERTSFFFSFYFSNPLKFVLGLTKWKFSTGKKHFTPAKKSGKITLPLRKKIPGTPLKQNIKRHVDTLTPSTPPHSLLQKS